MHVRLTAAQGCVTGINIRRLAAAGEALQMGHKAMQLDRLYGSVEPIGTLVGVVLLLIGVVALRRSWLARGGAPRAVVLGGWLAIAAGFALFISVWGGEVGTAYGLLALSLTALGVVAAGIELRGNGKPRESRALAPEPEDRPTNWPRAAAKSLLSIVIAGAAAIGIGVAFAVNMPMSPVDRIVIGGLLVPVLWGGGMAWTLYDAKLLRVTAVLVSLTVISFAVAFLPGVLV